MPGLSTIEFQVIVDTAPVRVSVCSSNQSLDPVNDVVTAAVLVVVTIPIVALFESYLN